MPNRAQILVVDDDQKIAAALRRALTYEGYQVEVAIDGNQALERARARAFDLVVLDVTLPGVNGVDVCRQLRREGQAELPILLLTARDSTGDRVRGLDGGADDYLVKPFAYEELMARVRALLRRRGPLADRRLEYSDLVMEVAQRSVRRGGRDLDLTATEFELLHHLLRNPRQVLSRDQLLDAVWGFDFGATSNLVDVYVGYLRQKLEAGGEPRLLQTVRGAGYALREVSS